MTWIQYLLTQLAQECSEVGIRASKAAMFGVEERQPGQPLDNTQRISEEFADLIGVIELLKLEGVDIISSQKAVEAKMEKVRKYFNYSILCGQSSPSDVPGEKG